MVSDRVLYNNRGNGTFWRCGFGYKTFLFSIILATITSRNVTEQAIASSGTAETLLKIF